MRFEAKKTAETVGFVLGVTRQDGSASEGVLR